MKLAFRLTVLSFMGAGLTPSPAASQVVTGDSLALVAIHQALDGYAWTTRAGWLTEPVGSWFGITVEGNRVTEIDLGRNGLRGQIPSGIGTLDALRVLRLDGNDASRGYVTGPLPPEIGKLRQLVELDLSGLPYLEFPYPPEFWDLLALEILDLRGAGVTEGRIPPEIGRLHNLRELWLGGFIYYDLPAELGELANLEHLYIYACHLTGTIPPEFGRLSRLKVLYIDASWCPGGRQLTGPLPAELGNLAELEDLRLLEMWDAGPLPQNWANLGRLKILGLRNIRLTGPVPHWLGQLRSLEQISLGSNELEGSLPSELANLEGLRSLGVAHNPLSGTLPLSLTALGELGYFDFSDTELCEPDDQAWMEWRSGVATFIPSGCLDEGTAVDPAGAPPDRIAVEAVYPNPASTRTTILYRVPRPSGVSITLIDVAGRTVLTPTSGFHEAGSYELTLDMSGLTPGVYLCVLSAGALAERRTVVLLR